MKNTFVATLRLLRCNWRAILLFELVYRVVLIALVGPVFKLALNGAMAIEGFAYLTHENVNEFLSRPPVVVIAVLVLLLLALYELCDIAALHYVLGLSQKGERAFPIDAMSFAVRQGLNAFKPRNLLLLPFTLLVVPLLSLGVVLGLVFTMEPPELFFEHIDKYTSYITAGGIAVVVALVLLSCLLFVYAYSFFGGDSFVGASRKSWTASRKHALGNLVSVLVMQVVMWLACFAVLALIGVPLALVVPADIAGQNVSRMTLVTSFALIPAAVVAGLLINSPTGCAVMLARLSLHGSSEAQPELTVNRAPDTHRMAKRVAALAVAIACFGWGAYHMWTTIWGPMYSFKHDGHVVTITGHRGGGANAPENTLAAFSQGDRDGADVCELDVQMSKDGKIFVSHDSDFRRISGVDKGAWELTYDEIRELDATGKRWQDVFEKQHYPLLDEVLDWAAEANMTMNIELKPTGHEKDFEQAVVDIIRAHDFSKRCIVTSQVYDTIKNVKDRAPELTCVYVARFLYGDAYKMEGIDVFSIEENSVKPVLVANLHDHGKTVLTWTVDAPRGVELAVLNGTDSLITDDVPMAKDVLSHMRE